MGAPIGNRNAAGKHKSGVSKGAKAYLKRTARGNELRAVMKGWADARKKQSKIVAAYKRRKVKYK